MSKSCLQSLVLGCVVAACSLDALGPDAVDGIERVNDSIADMNNSDDAYPANANAQCQCPLMYISVMPA